MPSIAANVAHKGLIDQLHSAFVINIIISNVKIIQHHIHFEIYTHLETFGSFWCKEYMYPC